MARWIIVRDHRGKEGLRLVYQNLLTLKKYDLGGIDSTLPDDMVVDWVFNYAEHLEPGDWFSLSDGRLLQFSRQRGAA